jgi:outer membrane lipoprotein SlyB
LTVYYGTVLNVADVQIQTETKGVVGGAAAGSKAEEKMKIKPGIELEVEFDDGRLMVIVQEKDDEYAVGDRIRVVEAQDGTLRVRQ